MGGKDAQASLPNQNYMERSLSLSYSRITASNLSQQEKDSVKGLSKLLGGQYTVKMGFRNTHLVVPFAAGDKYKGAVRFEVLPVTYRWLVDSAKTGRLPRSFTPSVCAFVQETDSSPPLPLCMSPSREMNRLDWNVWGIVS